MPKYLYLTKDELMIRFLVSEISIQNVEDFRKTVELKKKKITIRNDSIFNNTNSILTEGHIELF